MMEWEPRRPEEGGETAAGLRGELIVSEKLK